MNQLSRYPDDIKPVWFANARVVLPDRIFRGYVAVQGGKILEVGLGDPAAQGAQVVDLNGLYLAPGFIELHTYGAGGFDYMDGTVEAMCKASQTHFEHGTTTLCPTTLAASFEEIVRAMDAFRAAADTYTDGPALHGLHMEGPYLNPMHKGAIDEKYIRNPDPAEYDEILKRNHASIARWTLAPELPGAPEFIRRLRQEGILPSMGHSNAEYSQILEAYAAGSTHLTHMYSCMSTIVRRGGFRYPGLIESPFLIDGLTVELIADGCHVPPEMLRMVYKLLGPDRVALTCDSIRCAGQDVAEAIIGSTENGYRVLIEDGVAKLSDRSAFAGSIATDDRLVRVMHQQAGVPLHDCVRMMSLTPAKILGIDRITGSIAPGKQADLVCFDDNIAVKGVRTARCGRLGLLA